MSDVQSRLVGGDTFIAKLSALEELVCDGLETDMDEEISATQQEMADNVPVDTGRGRETILKDEARLKIITPSNGSVQWRLGFLTKAMQAAAFHLFWVEFGTKGYQPGEKRNAGFDKRGRRRKKKVKRFVPARPAQPFFRPAASNFIRRVAQKRNWAKLVAGAKEKIGLN